MAENDIGKKKTEVNMRKTLGMLFCLWGTEAIAHPFSKNEYSLRTAIKVSEKGVIPLVALEVPIPVVLKLSLIHI